MRKLLTTTLLQGIVVLSLFVLAWLVPSEVQAGCCLIRFNDPDLKIVQVPAHPDGPSIAVVSLPSLETRFLCCPPGNEGGNEGCPSPTQEHRIVNFNVDAFANLNNKVCKNNTCILNFKDIVTFNDVANFLDENVCSPHEIPRVVVNGPSGPELVPAMVFREMTFVVTGVRCGGAGGTDCTCTSSTNPACTIYYRQTVLFDLDPPFDDPDPNSPTSDLPMHGNFKETSSTIDCNTLDNSPSPCIGNFVFP